jgi:hypothetical protein
MVSNNQINYEALLMLIILYKFHKVKNEIQSITKLFFLTALLRFPNKINEWLSSQEISEINLTEFYLHNIELEGLRQKKYFDLNRFIVPYGKLLSKGLIKVEDGEIIKISDTGKEIINNLNEFEWDMITNIADSVKRNLGDKSYSKLRIEFGEIFPVVM